MLSQIESIHRMNSTEKVTMVTRILQEALYRSFHAFIPTDSLSEDTHGDVDLLNTKQSSRSRPYGLQLRPDNPIKLMLLR